MAKTTVTILGLFCVVLCFMVLMNQMSDAVPYDYESKWITNLV